MPQVGSNNIRREILSQLKQELNDFFTQEKIDLEAIRQRDVRIARIDKNLYQPFREVVIKQTIEEIMRTSILSGKGKVTKDIKIASTFLQQTLIMQIKDRLSREQLKLAMNCTQKSFLDTSVSLNTRTSIILNLFKLYEEFKKRQMDGL